MESPRRIRLLYFAALKERLGSDGEEIDLPAGIDRVGDLKRFLPTLRPRLAGVLDGVRFAVGDEFATLDRPLASGDIVALLPPVSGG